MTVLVPSDLEVHPLHAQGAIGDTGTMLHVMSGDRRPATHQTPGTQYEILSVSYLSILIKITVKAYTGTHTQPQPTGLCVLAVCLLKSEVRK